MKRIKVASVQMNALKDDLDHNLDVHAKFVRRAARENCHLIMFPELSATAHYGDEKVVQFAEEAGDGPVFETISALAAKHDILVSYGFCELAHGTHYNSQALVGQEGLIGIQRKVHASGDEYFSFRMGRSLDVYDIGFCRVGTLICCDSAFSEAWRVLALKGAEVILLPHASRSGSGKRIQEKEQLTSLKSRLSSLPGSFGIHAPSNGVFAVFGNQVDYNGHSTHAGGTYILDPFGGVMAKGRVSLRDQMVTAELQPQALDRARRASGFLLRTRRPEVYTEITRMI